MGFIKKYKKLSDNIMKIYLVGDVGDYSNMTKTIFKNIVLDSEKNDVIILLGDNFYPNGVNSVDDLKWNNFKELLLNVKTFAVLGNHDYLGNVKAQINFKKYNWNMDNHYYKRTFDKFEFFFIDTSILVPDYCNLNYNIVKSKLNNEPTVISKNMIEWLDVETNKSNKIKIVIGHYPVVSFGMYGINKKLFEILFPIFKKNSIKYYISGHDHNLQIIDITSQNYSFKQLISGSGSVVYPILKNMNKKSFSSNGYLTINTLTNMISMNNYNNKLIYTEKIE